MCEIVTSLSDTPVREIVMKFITDVQVYEVFMIPLLNMPECEIVTVFLSYMPVYETLMDMTA